MPDHNSYDNAAELSESLLKDHSEKLEQLFDVVKKLTKERGAVDGEYSFNSRTDGAKVLRNKDTAWFKVKCANANVGANHVLGILLKQFFTDRGWEVRSVAENSGRSYKVYSCSVPDDETDPFDDD
jgi:hypothetical protein